MTMRNKTSSNEDSGQNDTLIAGERFNDLMDEEMLHIFGGDDPNPPERKKLYGLAFSGGGIRSSTFSLGVTQALARMGWLDKFHYLSTVSGGGYIGSSLTWVWHKLWKCEGGEIGFDSGENFPYRKYHGHGKQAGDISQPQAMLRHLRQRSNYLTPGNGITGLSLVAVMLRGILLSLVVYMIPLLALMHWMVHAGWLAKLEGEKGMVALAASSNASDPILHQLLQHLSFLGDLSAWQILVPGVEEVVGASPLLCWGLEGFALFAGLSTLYGLLSRVHFGLRSAYLLRRGFEIVGALLIKLSAMLLVLGSLPYAAHALHTYAAYAASSMSLGGLLGAFFSVSRLGKGKSSAGMLGILAPVVLALLVYGLFLGTYLVALRLDANMGAYLPYYVSALALAVALGLLVNINYISIHRYYRDRLMELFMPDVCKVMNGERCAMAEEANGTGLHDMSRNASAKAPYHIINANMVTMDSRKAKLRARGGDNFILSPLFCGSEATGWRASSEYMKGKMNLATAMAISGAAADPHGAPGGEGLLRNRSLALLMALLNIRLGYWAPNPRRPAKWWNFNAPTYFAQGGRELTGIGMHEDARYVHLADGGHFENLALYELVRRKVRTIIVCDGAADAGYSFADFANFVEKVRVDFAADIVMPSFLPMCPKPERDRFGNIENPYGVDLAEKGYIKGSIIYADGSEGMLIYIKTTLIGHLPKDIYGYKSAHDTFPDETTADQFFDEKQFEAYRELGYRIGKSLLQDDDICERFAS